MGSKLSSTGPRRPPAPALHPNQERFGTDTNFTTATATAATCVFLNNVVLAKIASHLPPEDLFRLRSTTTAWNRAFIPEIRRRHRPIRLTTHDQEGLHHQNVSISRANELSKGRKDDSLPFGRYNVINVPLDSDSFAEFISVCGETVRSIEFVWDRVPTWQMRDNTNNLRTLVFKQTPQLEELSICLGLTLEYISTSHGLTPDDLPGQQALSQEPGESRHIVGPLPKLKQCQLTCHSQDELLNATLTNFLNDLIRNATGLKRLECMTRDVGLQVLRGLRDHSPALSNLKIMVFLRLEKEEVEILEGLGTRTSNSLHLKSFTTSIWLLADSIRYLDLLHSFLAAQSSTLVSLDLEVDGAVAARTGDVLPGHFILRLPQMVALRSLRLAGRAAGQIEFCFEPFEDGGLCGVYPNLRCLHLIWGTIAERFYRNITRMIGQLSHPGVTELSLSQVEVHLGDSRAHARALAGSRDELLEELGQTLPAVTRFKAEICGAHIPECIKTVWPSLTVLEIEYHAGPEPFGAVAHELTHFDEWLTGISRSQDVKTVMAGVMDGDDDDDEKLRTLRTISTEFKTLPGITDLTNLRSFTFVTDVAEVNLTDIGGYLGLALSSRQLERLVVRSAAYKKPAFLSKECRSLIRVALGPHAVIQIHGDHDDGSKAEPGMGRLKKLESMFRKQKKNRRSESRQLQSHARTGRHRCRAT